MRPTLFATLLAAHGMETAAGDAIALGYFDEVLAQFGGEGEPRFTVGQCETILRPLLALQAAGRPRRSRPPAPDRAYPQVTGVGC